MCRAKFTVVSVNAGSVNMVPVTGNSEENNKFFSATPAGGITMHVVNEEAYKEFEVGSEYYVDFTKVGSSKKNQEVNPESKPNQEWKPNQDLSEQKDSTVNPFGAGTTNQENK